MRTYALSKIPNANNTSTIATNQFTLIRMNDNIIDGDSVVVIPLQTTSPSIPDLHSTVLRAGYHPPALAMERDACDIVRVTLEGHDRVGIGGFDVEKLDIVMTGGREVALVGCDT